MRPTKKYSCFVSLFPDYVATSDDEEYECEICGFEPMFELFEFRSSVAYRHEGLDERWKHRYHVCLDCFYAGADSFPERLRKHAPVPPTIIYHPTTGKSIGSSFRAT